MRVQILALLAATMIASGVFGVRPAAARTDCKKNVTAVCVELAGHVDAYRSLLWSICDADSEQVCACYDAQQRESGVDWCQWAACACQSIGDATRKNGVCGLATACTAVATVKQQQQAVATQSAPARLGAQVDQVRGGQIVDCSPEACLAVGSACARAVGALEILKDNHTIKDGASCSQAAKDAAGFGKRLHVDGLTPAIGACACAAAF
jgi:hypothetical protein